MKLTAFSDYSLRVLMYLATDPDRRATVAEIAGAYGISEHHLVKVVHFLGRLGVVETVRGKGGGLQLAREPAAINLGQVVRQTEGDAVPAECFQSDGGACRITRACGLRPVLAEAVEGFYAVLDRVTLADITRNRRTLSRLLTLEED